MGFWISPERRWGFGGMGDDFVVVWACVSGSDVVEEGRLFGGYFNGGVGRRSSKKWVGVLDLLVGKGGHLVGCFSGHWMEKMEAFGC